MSNSQQSHPNLILEQFLEQASHGESKAIHSFFGQLLKSELYVPERYQDSKLSDAPAYPNDFFNFLGIRHGERSVVPLFTRQDLVQEWCGSSLQTKLLKSVEIFERIPQDWWICINPGADIEKELSPWEIESLRAGESALEAVVAEASIAEEPQAITLQTPEAHEFLNLKNALLEFGNVNPVVRKLFVIKEISESESGANSVRILVGVDSNAQSPTELSKLQEQIQNTAQHAQIGAEPVKVLIGGGIADSLLMGSFKNCEPFYQSSSSQTKNFWQRLKLFFGLSV